MTTSFISKASVYPESVNDRIVRLEATDVEDTLLAEETLKVYPVPAVSTVNFELPAAGDLMVVDMKGQVVMQKALYSGVNTVNISALSSGVYVYVVKTATATYKDMIVIK